MVKVERSFPAPKSLAVEAKKAAGSYREKDVIEQLRHDFNDKCYICELKPLPDVQVEHLKPHKGGLFKELKFAWGNLFLSCVHCNSVKNKNAYDEGIIDCCKIDPEERISFRLVNASVHAEARNPEDEVAILTAKLVNDVFNTRNTGMRVNASEYRTKALNLEMDKLYASLEELKHCPDSTFAIKKVNALLRKETCFAAFKREYVRIKIGEYPQFSDLVELFA